MALEVGTKTGAGYGEKNGFGLPSATAYLRPRFGGTRAGTVEAALPKLRTGSYFPSFLESRRTGGEGPEAVIQGALYQGVSTRFG